MKSNLPSTPSNFLLYTAAEGNVRVKIPAINKHLKNIFETNELQESSVDSILETVQKEELSI